LAEDRGTVPKTGHPNETSEGKDVTMRRAITTAVLAVALGVSACGGAQEEQFTMGDGEAIRRMDADFVKAFNAKDLDTILGMYSDNSVFMPPNAPALKGKEPLKSFYNELFSRGPVELRMDPNDVGGHGPIGFQNGSYSLNAGDTRDRGKFLFVMRKMGTNWKYEHTIWSSDLPPPAPPAK
jgi:ketosteroid isomerase-like protein